MAKLQIQPFADEHLEAAATLLAERHRTHRQAEPLLPDVFDFRPHVEEAWHEEGASGWIAFDDGEPVGYLIGAPRAKSWGEGNVWVGLAGHAVREAEVVRDLYAIAAAAWVEQGVQHHYAIVPATNQALVDAWFRLSFGAQHAQGIREVPEADAGESDFVVRRAGVEDAEIAARLDQLLPDFQARSPVFGGGTPPGLEELIADYADEIDDRDRGVLLVERDGKTVGLLTLGDVSHSGMHVGLSRPERAAILGLATTLPEVRGSGAGLALTDACFAWAREHGYETIVVDWRETNLRASRFWPRRGFRRTFLRLYRAIS
jgi:ribosomal protein S18 acetylase RimI-like enzyme